jgi:hypothetical protein
LRTYWAQLKHAVCNNMLQKRYIGCVRLYCICWESEGIYRPPYLESLFHLFRCLFGTIFRCYRLPSIWCEA